MLREREIVFLICVTFCLNATTIQKQFGSNHGESSESDDWAQMKWDSILKDPRSDEINKISKDDSNNIDSLLSFGDESSKKIKSNIKFGESELDGFAEDEVFVAGKKALRKRSSKDISITDVPIKQTNEDNSFNLSNNENEFLFKNGHVDDNENVEPKINSESSESKVEPHDSELLTSNAQELKPNEQQSDIDLLDHRSFIFNPNAKPQEQFQNCTTPKNESGTCRYLQHCLIPTIVSSLTQFLDYVCVIEGSFIGVCCPHFPVSVVMIEDQKGPSSQVESAPNEECGVSTNTRIVGGSKADPKSWPWMVALLAKFRKRFFCGGALINDRYVLTAAHCTYGVFNNEIIARLGEYDFKDNGNTHDEYAVVEIKRHGHYSRRSLRNDIALLKLEKPVVFNAFIKPICFPEEENMYIGKIATLAGWGNIGGGGKTSDILQQASFPVISNSECSIGHGLPIVDSLICTGAESGDKGACNGDSGGPLMLLDRNNRWKAIGLVSWGRRGCNPEFPTVYTRVSHFLDWIKKHSS